MKKVLLPVMALLMLFAAAPVIAAPATKTLFATEARFVPGNISQGEVWITKDGIRHVKGAISEASVTGDILGTMWLVSAETIDLNTGEGSNHGTFVFTVDEGTFEGSFQSAFTPLSPGQLRISGTFVGQGTGIYEGQKIMASSEGKLTLPPPLPPVVEIVLKGIILSP
ncbi:MAG: hypothetical protein ACETVM_04560 [Candidatus Bathyarchaeia archaeon]